VNRTELLKYLEGCTPSVHKGVVTLTKEVARGEGWVEDQDVPLPEGCKGYVDEHPEGSDRGGYCPFVELPSGASVFYYEGDGTWQVP